MQLNPPVGRFSEPEELESWIRELERLLEDPELQGREAQEELRRHLNDARTWLVWDLHRKVKVEGREVGEALREVGAFRRSPGDPPPVEETG